MQIALIPADPSLDITFHDVERGQGYLGALQELVSGDIQAVTLQRYAMTMYLNENGKLEGLPANHRATVLAHWAEAVRSDDIIAGDVVLTGPIDSAGEDTPIVDNHKWWLLRFDDEQTESSATS
ncbi:DUF3846 domain-containing protein [Pseudarthrobacter sp. BIM B-2242]|uniref:DUF3846 domain-containing protein n=1 Tax=Pseudarthrobacter sp. BIM B-2242 TaxID=2772401 RepID=UPI00168A69C1|nr:DUF3846 domain-containing protein [Pseudarthrobacter sp. BIM B-2242]QOD05661.1 DUF3846 domain-containing protein [Pseudarthrobacter sp. BIM B-2242]